MSLESLVNVSISSTSVNVQQAGFGLPMVLSANASFPERFRTYTDLAGLVTDGFATDSPEYLAAASMLAQSPSPGTFAVGRMANKPVQVYTIDISTLTADTDYSVTCAGEGVTTTTVTVDSASLTDFALATALAAEIDGVTGANYSASSVGSLITVSGTAAGDFFSMEISDLNRMEMQQVGLDPGVTADLTAISDENDSYYFILNPYNSEAMINSVAAYAESADKIFVAGSNDSRSATLAVGGGDPFDDLKTNAYARTAGLYHPSPIEFADAAFVGKNAPKDPGSITWNYKTLAGIPAVPLTSTHITNLKAKYANFYRTVAGVNITDGGGKVGANEYIDVVRGKDWITARIAEAIFARLAGSDKIPFTNAGVAVVQSEVSSVLSLAVDRGILSDDPAPVVTVPFVADVATADKSNRLLRDVEFTATLAGAIHTLIITGVVSV